MDSRRHDRGRDRFRRRRTVGHGGARVVLRRPRAVPAQQPVFVQDVGAFQIGLGAVLLIAAFASHADVLAVALLGVGIGSVAHAVSHVLGIDLGGRPALDIPVSTALAVMLLVAGVVRWRASGPYTLTLSLGTRRRRRTHTHRRRARSRRSSFPR